jgi:UDP-glucose 4-epimerase
MTSKTVLITGAAGFLGSNLTDALLARGHRVIGYDNLSHGLESNLDEARQNPNFVFHKAGVCDLNTFRQAARGVDVIAHLAAYKIPRYGNAEEMLLINSQGGHNGLELAAENHAKFILASTSDVYGKNPSIPFSETSDSVIGTSTVARWGYAVSKLFDEHLALAYADSRKVPVTIIRIFGSYGPRQALSWWGGPQSVFIDANLQDEPISIHGDGLQTRSFTYVTDTVSGFVAAIEREDTANEIFNVGSTHEVSIVDLAKLIHRLSGSTKPLKLQFTPYDEISKGRSYEDVRRRVPDVRKAEERLGFRARVELEEGLKRTIEWQTAVRSAQADLATVKQ